VSRIDTARKRIKRLELDGILITNPKNIYYLTGFTGDAGLFYITPRKAIFITDYRFEGLAEKEIKDADVVFTRKGYFNCAKQMIEGKAIGFEDIMPYRSFQDLKKEFRGIRLKPVENFVGNMRRVKDEK
jgi:Xaa-Pro aminopeptidase